MQKAAAATGIAREFKDIFELDGVPAFARFYREGIFVWKQLYKGFYKDWHLVPAPSIDSPGATRQLYRLNAAKAVCAELAGLVWGEQAEVRVSTQGTGNREQGTGNREQERPSEVRAEPASAAKQDAGETRGPQSIARTRGEQGTGEDPLNEFVQHVLRQNAFGEKLQQLIEQGLALGGAAIKVWAEPIPKGTGNRVQGTGDEYDVRLGYVAADQFVPLSWDNVSVFESVFVSRVVKGKYFYTRLEWHRRTAAGYAVDNELYRSDMENGVAPGKLQDILGARVPLSELYPGLEEHTEVPNGTGLFAYFRTPVANNLDDNSPLGVSIYANALETLHALDICYDSFVNEFRLGKKRIIVPARCVRQVADPVTGQLRRYFDPRDEVYEAFASDDKDDLRITDTSVELRVEEHVSAMNAFLSILCLQLGFSASTFSFDEHGGLKTATEVVSENSKTFKTIRTVKNQLSPVLEKTVRTIIDVAALYGVTWKGQSVAALAADGYEVKITFDDSVTQDRQTNLNEGVMLVGAGLLSKLTFLTDRKYGIGLTEAEAMDELKRIAEEKRAGEV